MIDTLAERLLRDGMPSRTAVETAQVAVALLGAARCWHRRGGTRCCFERR